MLKRSLDVLNTAVSSACVFLFITLLGIISAQIVSRYFFKDPLVWTEEGARFLFIWICLLGATVAHRNKTHIGIDYFLSLSPKRVQLFVEFLVHLLIFFFLLLLMTQGHLLAKRGVLMGAVTLPGVHWGHIYFSIPLSAFIMCMYSLGDLFGTAQRMKPEKNTDMYRANPS